MYAYKPHGERRGGGSERYLGAADKVMILIGVAAVIAMIVSGFVTHGDSVLTALKTAFGR